MERFVQFRLCPSLLRLFFLFLLLNCPLQAFPRDKVEAIRRLQERAEQEMSSRNYVAAKTAFLEILDLGYRDLVSKERYISLVLRLASAEAALEELDRAEERLMDLMQASPDEQSLLKIQMLRAQLFRKRGQEGKAYQVLVQVQDIVRFDRWPSSEKSFFQGLEYSLNRHYGDHLRRAIRLQSASLHREAIILFKEVLQAAQDGIYPAAKEISKVRQMRYHLAHSYFLDNNYSESLAILEELKTEISGKRKDLDQSDQAIHYLLARNYQNMNRREHAVDELMFYLSLGDQNSLEFYEQAYWNLAKLSFERNDFDQSKAYLEKLDSAKDVKIYYLSRIYLAKIALHTYDYQSVDLYIEPLLGIFPEDEDLRFEAFYLWGESYFQRKIYNKAIHAFEQAIPKRNRELADWYPQTLYNLAWSAFQAAQDQEDELVKQALFEKATLTFEELLNFEKNDLAFLALVRLYIERSVSEPALENKAMTLLEEREPFSNLDFEMEALILKGRILKTYSEKENLFYQATQAQFSATALYGQAWSDRAMNAFEEGLESKNPEFFQRAVFGFSQAFEWYQKRDRKEAARMLKFAAQSFYHQETKETRVKAFKTFQTLFRDYDDLLLGGSDRDEMLYLQAVVASQLLYEDQMEEYIEVLDSALVELIDNYPHGKYADSALNLLATVSFRQHDYDKSERLFNRLASDYPRSKYAAEAWFWAAESAQWQDKDPETVQHYRKMVFEEYHMSPLADEAYFKYYHFNDYMQGNAEALFHLQSMENHYPYSPFLMVAHYLMGLNHKQDRTTVDGTVWKKADLGAAIHEFEEAYKVFDRLFKREQISKANLEYFITVRYRALLERALIKLEMAQEFEGAKQQIYLEWAADAFKEVINDFEQADHPLSSVLFASQVYPRIFEECEYGLAQVYLHAKDEQKAEEVLSTMLERYVATKKKEGYYLSRVWYEQGRIAMRRQEYELSLKFFKRAEETGKSRLLSSEQRLDLWIQQSHSHRELKNYDDAMLMLSKVINEDVVSPLRLKAMFLRAEIYEIQGRHELAVRQLEASAEKGGFWANKAKEKLEKDYGFH